ncbi:hypothetical protein J6590_095183, partial [Homalodisca vitripennis]
NPPDIGFCVDDLTMEPTFSTGKTEVSSTVHLDNSMDIQERHITNHKAGTDIASSSSKMTRQRRSLPLKITIISCHFIDWSKGAFKNYGYEWFPQLLVLCENRRKDLERY